MDATVIDATVVTLAVAVFATGLFAGVLAGLLGVGGGIVIVPVLFHIFTGLNIDPAVKMHLAVGTSLATIIPTSIISARAHHKRGSVDFDLLKSWAPMALIGALIGTFIAAYVKGAVLTGVFAVVALIVAAHMAFAREGMHLSDRLPRAPIKHLIAVIIGGFSTMMGIGGGTLSVPTLTLFNFPIKKAVGTASALGLVIAIPGTIGFLVSGLGVPDRPPFSLGYVSLIGFALIVPATMLAAPWGAKLAHAMSTKWLRRAFALFLAITSARMFYSLYA
ncbi:MAG: sulfite exporter TauE/SafE family protein [Alphaproteobacteria bacterium]|nr:sulfite exporter TauE/SafE family protein [Alphaproteobacteria bacterium]MBU0796181.1 sulfite exporter TauE/SafE family protein [Alphaproteobacteria bacterium]MBU0887203.1 sulfite exporter TauE/SafE family protein [Alphaproteobacteria bacterium]MBU1812269.1 sulfite exporter TauE/SafE family protein [Alphaproteobacteria bacterium]